MGCVLCLQVYRCTVVQVYRCTGVQVYSDGHGLCFVFTICPQITMIQCVPMTQRDWPLIGQA